MRALGNVLLGLFRPGDGLERAGTAAKWLWVPLTLILIGTVLLKTVVATPLKSAFQEEEFRAAMSEQFETMSDSEREEYDQMMSEAQASGDLGQEEIVDTAMSVSVVADIVFGVLGAVVAIIYIATFFFVAAKTWANPVMYTTMLTIASLSLLPHAIRNVLQAIYMSASDVWLRFPGLGALVAPNDPLQAPGVAYALLSQIDLFVLWGLAILFGALLSSVADFEKKRALSATIVFMVITGVLQAIPTLVAGLFTAGMS